MYIYFCPCAGIKCFFFLTEEVITETFLLLSMSSSFQTFFVNTKFKYMFKVTTVFLSMHALFSMK